MRAVSGLAAALLAGVAQTFSFAPFEAWWLQIAALALLAHLARDAGPGRAALLGWAFATGWLTSGLWWLYISLHDFGGLAAGLAALAVLLLAAALALYYAAALAIWARLRSGRALVDGALFAACWLLAELARATLFTGFPWIASGYAHAVGPLAAWAPWIGVYGISALAAWLAFAAAALPRTLPRAARIAFGAGAILLLSAPGWLPQGFTQGTGTLAISLVQPAVAQDLKFDAARMESNLLALVRQVEAARGTLVVTPESVIPFTRAEIDPALWARMARPFEDSQRALLVGLFTGDAQAGYVNSVVGAGGTPPGYQYGKRHLLPFGEFVPPGFRWFVDLLQIPLGDQARGTSSAPLEVGGQRVRPLICYEDLFGEDIVDSVVAKAPATIFANVSNLAWFGTALVQDQHLQFSQMRALEFERPVVRATNTGATAVVDHRGHVAARLPPGVAGTLDATVEGRTGATPYARWLAAFGLWPLWLAAAAVIAVASLRRRLVN
jgi:apolipoprotein N-acyltransferase